MNGNKEKLVIIGNGMAGISTVEQILKLSSRFDITVFGTEPYPNYNRIMLSYVLEGSKTLDDIDWLKKITESKMLDKVNKILELLPGIINKNMTTEEIINALSSLFIKPEKKQKKAK